MKVAEVPDRLVSSILNGRCVAFVGAGFTGKALPTWGELLEKLAGELRVNLPNSPSKGSAFHHEAIGQKLRDVAGDEWESLVARVLTTRLDSAEAADRETLQRRKQLLMQIPFRAILTTNFDPTLEPAHDALDPTLYADVLREDPGRWWNAPRTGGEARLPPVVKLHGHANGRADILPIVLGRADYRARVYADRNYANFVRSVFASYTVLFLGVSFSDAYLNELRSEVLQLVYERGERTPWGYAVVHQPTPLFAEFLRRDEGIEILRTDDHKEFDEWLGAISERTSIQGRLRRLLAGKRIVWVDRHHQSNNDEGHRVLRGAATVELLDNPSQLEEHEHGEASLILTSFGHAEALAFGLLDRVRTWSSRPPVIVFAAPQREQHYLVENRRQCLRRGAWEYATQWSELFRAIELAVGRVPGQADAY